MRQQVPPRLKTKSRHRTLAFNKPYGVLPCFTDAKGRPTLAEYVKAPGVYAAGRLDFDSEGLMVLTSDGALAHHITDPQHKLRKIYLAQVERYPVLARIAPGEIASALPAQAPEDPEPFAAIMADFERVLVPGLTHWNHPGFLAYFAITASAPGSRPNDAHTRLATSAPMPAPSSATPTK